MKQWLDEVFIHGFAHGSTAKLGGKKLILSFTTGAPQAAYSADGFFGHAIEEYLIPFETTARLCNLELLAPVYTCGISYADRDADKIAQQKTLAREHASRLVDLLNSVVNNPKGRIKMQYIRLGKSDLLVSRICMGCMGFGDPLTGQHRWTLDETASRDIIRYGLEKGINFYDTAIAYQNGSSERYVGRALREMAKREDVVLATKFLPRTAAQIAGGSAEKRQ